MAQTRQSFVNQRDVPVYVSVEPTPECFELEPGDKLTLIYDAAKNGDAILVNFINEREFVLWPNEASGDVEILFNDGPSEGRSWVFKHE